MRLFASQIFHEKSAMTTRHVASINPPIKLKLSNLRSAVPGDGVEDEGVVVIGSAVVFCVGDGVGGAVVVLLVGFVVG